MNVVAECRIQAPNAEVFQVFADLPNLSERVQAITGIEMLTPGDVGVGTRFKETRVMFGKEATEVMEVTQFSPPEHIREEARSNGMNYVSDWTFTEDSGMTTVRIEFSGTAQTWLGKGLSLLFSGMAGSMKKAFLADMDDLKRFLETRP